MKRIITAITVFAIALFAFPFNLVKADGNKEIEAGYTRETATLINVGNGMKDTSERVEFVAVEDNSSSNYYLKFNVTAADNAGYGTYFHFDIKAEKGLEYLSITAANGEGEVAYYPNGDTSSLTIGSLDKNKRFVFNGQLATGVHYIHMEAVPRNVIEVNVTKEKDTGGKNKAVPANLTLGKTVTAGLDGFWDEDWFKLQTGNSEYYAFTFTNMNIDSIYNDGSFCTEFILVDSKGKEANFEDSNGQSHFNIQPLFIKKGKTKTYYSKLKKNSTYYIHVSGNGWDDPITAVNNFKGFGKYSIKVDVTPSSVKLNKTSATLAKGKTLQLTATVSPSNTSNKTVTWKSSNTKVATVSSTGKVTAVGGGTATITATTKIGNKKASAKITVSVSKEQGINDFVERCYTKALGRKSDAGGKKYWVNKILKAKNIKEEALKTASTGFFNSKEFLNKKTNNTEFVKICYRTFLGREAEAGGLKYWVNLLNTKKKTRNEVLQGFVSSKEFNNIMASYGIK